MIKFSILEKTRAPSGSVFHKGLVMKRTGGIRESGCDEELRRIVPGLVLLRGEMLPREVNHTLDARNLRCSPDALENLQAFVPKHGTLGLRVPLPQLRVSELPLLYVEQSVTLTSSVLDRHDSGCQLRHSRGGILRLLDSQLAIMLNGFLSHLVHYSSLRYLLDYHDSLVAGCIGFTRFLLDPDAVKYSILWAVCQTHASSGRIPFTLQHFRRIINILRKEQK